MAVDIGSLLMWCVIFAQFVENWSDQSHRFLSKWCSLRRAETNKSGEMGFLVMPFGLVLTVIGMITHTLNYSFGWVPLVVGVTIILSRWLSVSSKKIVRRRYSRTSLHTDSSYYGESGSHDYFSDSDGGDSGGGGDGD
ncbi:hypothetical protein [Photobacterium aquae]|uniref:hypothetical protein n=1 Tax=Photobacterium aquae TaxID=1195763 RepID=UPI0012ED1D39|nr:hypothetical protein [Photobacterium aquae]